MLISLFLKTKEHFPDTVICENEMYKLEKIWNWSSEQGPNFP